MYCESTEFMNQGTLAYHVALLHLSAIIDVRLGKLCIKVFFFLQVFKSTFSCSFGSSRWFWAVWAWFSWRKLPFCYIFMHMRIMYKDIVTSWVLSFTLKCLGCQMRGDWLARAYHLSICFTGIYVDVFWMHSLLLFWSRRVLSSLAFVHIITLLVIVVVRMR